MIDLLAFLVWLWGLWSLTGLFAGALFCVSRAGQIDRDEVWEVLSTGALCGLAAAGMFLWVAVMERRR